MIYGHGDHHLKHFKGVGPTFKAIKALKQWPWVPMGDLFDKLANFPDHNQINPLLVVI